MESPNNNADRSKTRKEIYIEKMNKIEEDYKNSKKAGQAVTRIGGAITTMVICVMILAVVFFLFNSCFGS